MKIKSKNEAQLVLSGTPGGWIWMVVMMLIGLLASAAIGAFAVLLFNEYDGLSWPHLPMGVGLVIGQALFWIGAVTLLVGRLSLTLDRERGTGEYQVKSPIIEAGRSCKFKLDHVRSVTLETTSEARPSGPEDASFDATIHRAQLRLSKPRRAIVLDETENNRVQRVEAIAEEVAEFLGVELDAERFQKTA